MCLDIMASSMSRLNKLLLIIAVLVIFFSAFKMFFYIKTPVDKNLLFGNIENSLTIKDRHRVVLTKLYPYYGGSYQPVAYNQIPPCLIHALISTEDKRFFKHRGVDILALLRAFKYNLFSMRIVSGGSTLTQQLVRITHNLKRSYKSKLYEMFLALRYECSFTKKDILTAYFNHVFIGNQIYGIKAASKLYFGKELKELSISESAFLIGILKSGTLYNPYKHFKAAEKRRRYVLYRMFKEGYINKKNYEMARLEGVNIIPLKRPFKAPHFCFYVKKKIKEAGLKNVSEIVTTLNWHLQKKIELIIKNNLCRLKGLNVGNASVVILDAKTGEILTMVGSLNYFDNNEDGQVNGALALRQPGSSLKPFLYAYIFSKGYSPSDIISDIKTHLPTASGDYAPINYDKKYHGPVSIREALSCSYNIPAVKWLFKHDYKEYIAFLKKLGFRSINRPPYFYGLSIALGTAEVRLLDMASAYTVFANKGNFIPVRKIIKATLQSGKVIQFKAKPKMQVVDPESIYLVNHILTDRNSRLRAFPNLRGIIYPFDIAFKTGTSKDYRDAWVVGYTSDYIVGIWLGNFKGKSMNKITGGSGAVPLLYDIFLKLNPSFKNQFFSKPGNIVIKRICPVSGLLVSSHCASEVEEVFIKGREPKKYCNVHKLYYQEVNGNIRKKVFTVLDSEYKKWCRENNWEIPGKKWKQVSSDKKDIIKMKKVKIIYPDNGDIFRVDPVLPEKYQRIELRAEIPEDAEYIEWFFNDKLLKKVRNNEPYRWELERGDYSIYAKVLLISGETLKSKPVKITVQ